MSRHSDPEVLEALDRAWDPEEGVLGLLRERRFSAEKAKDFVALLDEVVISEGEVLHADFVRLVWFAPLFIEWQVERVVEQGADGREVEAFCGRVRERLMELLGVP